MPVYGGRPSFHYPGKASNVIAPTGAVTSAGTLTNLPQYGGGSGYPPDTTIAHVALPTPPSLPTYLVPYTDPTWGTKITRITNIAGHKPYYPKFQCLNSAGDLLWLGGMYPGLLLDGNTYAVINSSLHHPTSAQWSHTQPYVMYGTRDDLGTFLSMDPRVDLVYTTIRTFAGYTNLQIGDSQGFLSDDDRYMVFQGTNAGVEKIFTYDRVADTVIATRSFATRPKWATISRSGNYVLAGWIPDGPGTEQGVWQFSRTDLATPIRQLTQYLRHSDIMFLADGTTEVWAVNPHIWSEQPYYARLSDGVRVPILPLGPPPTDMEYTHISGRAYQRPGWTYIAPYESVTPESGGYKGTDQLYAVKLDGSFTIEVFAWAYSADYAYVTAPFGSPSPDGKRFFFASRYGSGAGTAGLYTYVAQAGPGTGGIQYTDYVAPTGGTISALLTYITNTVPNGTDTTHHSRVLLSGTYSGATVLALTSRSHLTLEGQGTEVAYVHGTLSGGVTGGAVINYTSHNSGGSGIVNMTTCTDVRLHALTVLGASTVSASGGAYYATTDEFNAAVNIVGGSAITLDHITTDKQQGDGVSLRGHSSGATRINGVIIRGCRIRRTGRMGIAFFDVTGAEVVDTCLDDVALTTIDIEPNTPASGDTFVERVDETYIHNCTFGDYGWYSADAYPLMSSGGIGVGYGMGTTNITGNKMTAGAVCRNPNFGSNQFSQMSIWFKDLGTTKVGPINITNNVATTAMAKSVVYAGGISTLVMTGNTGHQTTPGNPTWYSNQGSLGSVTNTGNT